MYFVNRDRVNPSVRTQPRGSQELDAFFAEEARFKSHDEQTLDRQYAVYHDETKLRQTSIEAAKELEGLFEQDREDAPEINADGAVFSPSDVR